MPLQADETPVHSTLPLNETHAQKFETAIQPGSPIQESHTKSSLYLLLFGVFISLFVALYILRLIIRIWTRHKNESKMRASLDAYGG